MILCYRQCVIRYVLPGLRAATGQQPAGMQRIATSSALDGRKMTYFMPVKLVATDAGASLAQARPPQGSGDFLALAGTDGFIELPPRPAGYPAGFVADFHRW